MKKGIFLSLLVMALFLVGCVGNYPPEPSAPGETKTAFAGKAHAAPIDGEDPYATAYAEPTTFSISPDEFHFTSLADIFNMELSVRDETYVWYLGYYINPYDETAEWQPFEFPGARVGDGWISTDVYRTLPINLAEHALNVNWIVAYACTEGIFGWNCHDNKWMLHQYDILAGCPTDYSCLAGRCVRDFPCPPPEPGEEAVCEETAGLCPEEFGGCADANETTRVVNGVELHVGCPYGCRGGECLPPTSGVCTAGNICFTNELGTFVASQRADCLLASRFRNGECSHGCADGLCLDESGVGGGSCTPGSSCTPAGDMIYWSSECRVTDRFKCLYGCADGACLNAVGGAGGCTAEFSCTPDGNSRVGLDSRCAVAGPYKCPFGCADGVCLNEAGEVGSCTTAAFCASDYLSTSLLNTQCTVSPDQTRYCVYGCNPADGKCFNEGHSASGFGACEWDNVCLNSDISSFMSSDCGIGVSTNNNQYCHNGCNEATGQCNP